MHFINIGKMEKKLPAHVIAVGAIVLNDNGEILLVKDNRRGWAIPGGMVEIEENLTDALKREVNEEAGIEIEVGELFCVSSNTCHYPGYNGVKEVPTKIILDFICRAVSDTPRPSEENSESAFFPKERVMSLVEHPAIRERMKMYMEYDGRPAYLEYVTRPEYELRLKRKV